MSLTEGKNILVYVETAGDTPVGPALEILAKAKEKIPKNKNKK